MGLGQEVEAATPTATILTCEMLFSIFLKEDMQHLGMLVVMDNEAPFKNFTPFYFLISYLFHCLLILILSIYLSHRRRKIAREIPDPVSAKI